MGCARRITCRKFELNIDKNPTNPTWSNSQSFKVIQTSRLKHHIPQVLQTLSSKTSQPLSVCQVSCHALTFPYQPAHWKTMLRDCSRLGVECFQEKTSPPLGHDSRLVAMTCIIISLCKRDSWSWNPPFQQLSVDHRQLCGELSWPKLTPNCETPEEKHYEGPVLR